MSRLLTTAVGDIPICIRPNIHTLLVIMGAIYCEAEYRLVWHVALILDPTGIKRWLGHIRIPGRVLLMGASWHLILRATINTNEVC